MESTYHIQVDVLLDPAEVQVPADRPVPTGRGDILDSLDDGSRFMRGLLFATLLSLPMWAVILYFIL
jgi:hypothetical protein